MSYNGRCSSKCRSVNAHCRWSVAYIEELTNEPQSRRSPTCALAPSVRHATRQPKFVRRLVLCLLLVASLSGHCSHRSPNLQRRLQPPLQPLSSLRPGRTHRCLELSRRVPRRRPRRNHLQHRPPLWHHRLPDRRLQWPRLVHRVRGPNTPGAHSAQLTRRTGNNRSSLPTPAALPPVRHLDPDSAVLLSAPAARAVRFGRRSAVARHCAHRQQNGRTHPVMALSSQAVG